MTRAERLAGALDTGRLGQKEFAELGGWTRGHVNRWLRQRPADKRPVPLLAFALAAAYAYLTPGQRAQLRRELGDIEEDRAAFALALAMSKLTPTMRDVLHMDIATSSGAAAAGRGWRTEGSPDA